jgi:glycosyltransferase involved in cell wall biosynthesis
VTWYAAADVVALTTDREGTPLARIEPSARGRTVVAAPDIPALAGRIIRLARDPELRATMGRDAPARAAMYDAGRLAADLDRLYRASLMEAKRRS